MARAGFVLVGGRSARMGRDKALLPYRGKTLVDYVAQQVAASAGSVTLVGHPERYRYLGYPSLPDERPGLGPLGGILTALGATPADWNLVVACDMPGLTASFLGQLIEQAEAGDADCLAARSETGLPEPLCAVYHRRCRESLAAWLDSGRRKAAGWLVSQRVAWHPVTSGDWLRNANTPADWDPPPGSPAREERHG
ncbi:MAG: molybdenum cofactor guanylyltransferase [Acidobacteria bacterium]|nr:molybdenum cofactor guanylyltransferase [Acidobacteriota bacterium]